MNHRRKHLAGALAGAVVACEPTRGWWYWARIDALVPGIYGPFATREAARLDQVARRKTNKYSRYRQLYTAPLRAKAFVREENGRPTWRRCSDTIGARFFPPEGLFL